MKAHRSNSMAEANLTRDARRPRAPWILWRYIALDFVFSFCVTFIFFIVIFLFNQILLFAKNILEVNIPVIEVAKLLLFKLPEILSLSIPFATLVSCLMSVGGFSSHNEFVAMRGSGISFFGTLAPYVVLGVCAMLISFYTSEVLRPWGSIRFIQQYQKVLSLNPQLGLQSSSITRYQDDIIAVKTVRGTTIDGLFVLDRDSNNNPRSIIARRAAIRQSERGVIALDLYDVLSITDENKPGEYSYLYGKKVAYRILLKDITQEVQAISIDNRNISDISAFIRQQTRSTVVPQLLERVDSIYAAREGVTGAYEEYARRRALPQSIPASIPPNMQTSPLRPEERPAEASVGLPPIERLFDSVPQLLRAYDSRRKAELFFREVHTYRAVFHRKVAFSFAALLFVFVAFPAGLFYKRSGKSIGFGVGLILSFAYWFLSIVMQSISISSPKFSPLVLIWIPNVLVILFGALLLRMKRNI